MMKKKLNINWTIVALILTIIGVGYFISLVHEVNEKDREREYNIHHYSTGKVHQGVIQPVAARQDRRLMVIVRHPGAARLAAVHPIIEITTVDLRVNLLMRMTMM